MGKIINTKSITNSSETNAPKFNFSEYSVGQVYHNNEHEIDFVTDNKSLYVCLVDTLQTSKENIEEQEGLLKIISQGEQGIQGQAGTNGAAGITPRIDAHFDGKQLIFSVDGKIKAVSPDLGGPSWRPVVNGTTLTWELSMDRYAPESIDLKQLRPISEHPIILRTNSDNTKYDWETSGPANYIQWKYEGDEYWNNLISISELMNLAVAGVCFWYDEETEEWHFGHKEIVKATYTADKNGRQIISNVELGDVLFDAGAVPMPDYSMEIDTIEQTIDEIKASLAGYATEEWVEGKGYLTGVDLDDYAKKSEIPSLADAYTKAESDAKYQPVGTYLTTHQPIKTLSGQSLIGSSDIPLKTINGESIIGSGNITVSVGDANLFDLTTRTVNGVRHLIKTVNGVETDLGEFTNGSSSGTGSFDVKIDNNYLYKSTDNGTTWTQVGPVNSDTEGCAKCWSEEEITALFANNTIADLRIVNNVLQKKVNGSWSDVGSVGGGTETGCDRCWTEDEIRSLFDTNFLTKSVADTFYMAKSGVTVNTNLTSGVEIATITINGVATKLYAPNQDGPITFDVEYKHTFTLYQRNNIPNDGTPPTKPETGDFIWDGSSAVLTDTHAGTAFASPWLNSPENRDAANNKIYLWITVATYSSKTGLMGEWSNPVCITGANGEEGADGDGIEFVYHLGEADAPNLDYLHAFKGNNSKSFTSKTQALDSFWKTEDSRDWLPGDGDMLGNSHWTDNPVGISDENGKHIEWVAIRTSTYDATIGESVWTEFSDPIIWSMWGEDGMDGDGIEYIFYVSPENTSENSYYTIDQDGKYHLEDDGGAVWPPTTATETARISNYQESDWVPGNEQAAQGWDRNWTDNPIGISANRPYEWVSIRKRVNEVWQPFSEPALWAKYPKDGVAKNIYTSYIFTRTDQNISTFVLSDDIIPEDVKTYEDDIHKAADYEFTYGNGQHVVWSDTVPSTSNAQVWMSMNHINDDDWDQGWTSPVKLGDSDHFQVEYCASETIAKALPDLNDYTDETSPEGINETAFRNYMSTTYGETWGDENDITEPVWMATASKRNGVWTGWAYAKIKGEKGEAGTSVRIKHTIEYASDLSAFIPRTGNENSANVGDCYIVLKGTLNPNTPAFGHVTSETYESSHIWSYGGEDSYSADDTNTHMYGFDDLGEFANITPNNVYMRFARLATDAEQGTTTTSIAQVPVVIGGSTVNKWLALLASNVTGPFIGLYVGEDESQNIADYKWSKWNGEDYYGMESIFLKLEEDLTPTRPRLNLIGVSGNNTKITAFTTRDQRDGTITTINSVDTTTDTTNYKRFDYVPQVLVYEGNSSRLEDWHDTPQEIYDNTTTKYNCWQCTRNIAAGVYEWSDPIIYMPYVEDGTDGKDGAYEESVYLTENIGSAQRSAKWAYDKTTSSFKTATNGIFDWADALPLATTQYDSANSLPSSITIDNCWTDNPVGVDEDHKYEWIITRKITYPYANNPHTPKYGDFSAPRIRSRFGKDGIDGDGLEYVFWPVKEVEHNAIVAYNEAHSNSPLTPDDSSTDSQGRNKTQSEYLPLLIISSTSREAVDDYVKPTAEFKYTYASKRKYNGVDKTWTFGPVHLWDEYTDVSANTSCTIGYTNDMDPVRVDENYIPLSSSMYYHTYVTMRHVLDIKRPDVIKLGDTTLITMDYTSVGTSHTGTYNGSLEYNGITITEVKFTYYENNLSWLGVRMSLPTNVSAANTPFKDDTTVALPFVFISGNNPEYTGVGELYLNPTTSKDVYKFQVVTEPVIYKSDIDLADYDPSTVDFTVTNEDDHLVLADLSKIILTVKYDDDDKRTKTIPLASHLPAASTWKTPGDEMSQHFTYTKNVDSACTLSIMQVAAEDGHALDKFIVTLTVNLLDPNNTSIIRKYIDCYVGVSTDLTQDRQKVSISCPGTQGPEGRGVDSIVKAYHYDNDATLITNNTIGSATPWVDIRNDAAYRNQYDYVYIRTTTIYTKGEPLSTVEYSLEVLAKDGQNGTDGTSIPYTYRGEFETGVTYYNNSQRKDIVKYGSKYYIRKEEYNGQSDSSWNANRWTEFEGEYENIATGFLFAETGVIQNLKVAEVATNNSPNARITINEGGSGGTGRGNNAILGYSANSNEYGIEISGTELEDVFNIQGSTYFPNSETMEYHYDEQDDTGRTMYEGINASGTAYSEAIQGFYYDGTIDTTSIKITSAPDLTWTITENGTPITIEPSSALFLPDFDLVLFERSGSTYTPYATVGKYYWNDQGWTYNFGEVGFVKVTTSQNFYLGIVPTTRQWVGANYDGIFKSDGTSLNAGYCALTVTSAATNINYEYGTGQGHEGVTIAPNGILVYFDENNYFQFITINGTPQITLKKAGIDRLA